MIDTETGIMYMDVPDENSEYVNPPSRAIFGLMSH